MCCIAEVAMLIFGIIALVKGKFSLTGSRVVRKVPARIIGVILLLPLIIGQGVAFTIGFVKGVEVAAQGKQFTWEDAMHLQGLLLLVNGIVTGVSLVAALGIAIGTAKPPRSKRRSRIRDDEYHNYEDSTPRRRRMEEEEEYGERDRGRQDGEDDPRPRRRPLDD